MLKIDSLTLSLQSEVKFLGKFSHPNLVKLLGYCWEEKQFLLVYEYMQKGSLENHLFRSKNHVKKITQEKKYIYISFSLKFIYMDVVAEGAEPLSWEVRLKLAIGAAQGLAFLHTSEKSVIYRDFKTSNILLDGVNSFSFHFISHCYFTIIIDRPKMFLSVTDY